MELKRSIRTPDESKFVVERLVDDNLSKKLNSYLAKYDREWAVWNVELKIDKDKKWLFIWVLMANLDWDSFRYEREDYKKLDDLVNNLFDHLKLDLAHK